VRTTEAELLIGGRVAERDRLAELYGRHAPGALRLAYLLTGDRSAAEEIVQDAFVKLWGKFHNLQDPQTFGGYLHRTVTNLSRSHGRRLARRRRIGGRIDTPPAREPLLDEREALWRGLLQLPVRQRTAIFFRYYEDLTEAQTADVLGVSVGAVKSLTQRGMQKLREVIDRA
jgi:RNA polymerase sigma-70 factor (sigma-E family)